MTVVYAVSVRVSGGAIVAVDHARRPPVPVSIERLPTDLAGVAERVRDLSAMTRAVVIDPDARGESLRRLLGRGRWHWYRKTGRDRRELTDTLDATAAMPGFRFGPELAHRDEMRRALEALRRSVDEDGSPESEYAVALALALVCGPARPRIW